MPKDMTMAIAVSESTDRLRAYACIYDNAVQACAVRIRDGDVATSVEILPGHIVADYDAAGRLLAIEVLTPVPLDEAAANEQASRATRSGDVSQNERNGDK